MAALQFRNDSYRLLFQYDGKQETFTIGRICLKEAREWKARAENLLMRIRQGLLELPPGVGIADFLRHDGKPPVEPALVACKTTTFSEFRDAYQSPQTEPVAGQLDSDGNPVRRAIPEERRFNVFRDIKCKLVALGVPEEQIEDIHDHDSDRKKMLLFERVNKGEVRIIMGGTEKLGTGVNIQAKLKTLHHIDAPWRPSDMEQREGRILRQGNENPSVEIIRYGVDRSFDANAYQRLDTKQRFIQSIMSGANADREAEDVGAEAITSFADAFAAISGNPLVRERFDLETRIRNLERLQLQFEEDQCQARENLRRSKAEEASATKTAAVLRELATFLQPVFSESDRVKVINGDTTAEGREQACELLEAFVSKALVEVSNRLKTQLQLDRQISDVRERRISVPLHALSVNGLAINADAQVQYRPPEPPWSERISDPEIRYSFKIPGTDIWKSGNVTTGRGFLDSVCRKIAELDEDARHREGVAQSKRRQIEELAGLQGRSFTYVQELALRRARLQAVKADLERSTSLPQTAPEQAE